MYVAHLTLQRIIRERQSASSSMSTTKLPFRPVLIDSYQSHVPRFYSSQILGRLNYSTAI